MRKSLVYALILLAIAAPIVLASCRVGPASLSPNEEVEVYAAAIHQLATVDYANGLGKHNPTSLYIMKIKDDRVVYFFKNKPNLSLISETVQGGISSTLNDLQTVTVWTEDKGSVPFEKGVVTDGGIFTLGNIYPHKDRSLRVAVGVFTAGDGGMATNYVLTNTDGVWKVSGTTGPWAVS
jgi:hypothetical protein